MTSRMIRNCFLAAAFLASLSFAGAACAQNAEGMFKAKCSSCHGADGKGNTGVGKTLGVHDLTSDAVQKETDAEMTDIVAKGKNKMPAYAKSLKEADIKDLVAYIRQLGKAK
jgi:mono/diheme cytochrome c family protein